MYTFWRSWENRYREIEVINFIMPWSVLWSQIFICLFGLFRDGRTLVGGGKSRMLHMWNLETKKLIKILQLPAKVTMVKQLEFLPDSFDGGANQVGSNKFFSRKMSITNFISPSFPRKRTNETGWHHGKHGKINFVKEATFLNVINENVAVDFTQILGVLSQDGIMRFININTCKLLFDIGSADSRISNVSVSPSGRHIVAVVDSGNMHVYSVQALTSELNKVNEYVV